MGVEFTESGCAIMGCMDARLPPEFLTNDFFEIPLGSYPIPATYTPTSDFDVMVPVEP